VELAPKTMCYRTNCPCCSCDSTELLGYGVVAPWIVKLINGADPVKTQLRRCSQCGLRFFSYRYSTSEMALIYGNYRSDYFFKLRHHWEPWVNRQVNDAFSDDFVNKRQIEIRNVFTKSSLTEAGIDLNELKGCIDFGGDLGQFIPDAIKPPLVVYEPTGTRRGLRPSVVGCEKLSELVSKVDLGLNCYVLEHIDEPRHVVTEMVGLVNSGKFIHIEVPLDGFNTSKFHRTGLYFRYLRTILRFRLIWIPIDLISGIWRTCLGSIPWFGIVKQSEHINYFETNSLRHLCESLGLEILYVSAEDRQYSVGRVKQGRVSITVKT